MTAPNPVLFRAFSPLTDTRDLKFLADGGNPLELVKLDTGISQVVMEYILTHCEFDQRSGLEFVMACARYNWPFIPLCASYFSFDSINFSDLFNVYMAGYLNLFRKTRRAMMLTGPVSTEEKYKAGDHMRTMAIEVWAAFKSMFLHIDDTPIESKQGKYVFNGEYAEHSIDALVSNRVPDRVIFDAVDHGLVIQFDNLEQMVRDTIGDDPKIADLYLGHIFLLAYMQAIKNGTFDKHNRLKKAKLYVPGIDHPTYTDYLLFLMDDAKLKSSITAIEGYINSEFDPNI